MTKDSGDEEHFPYLFQTFIPNAGEGEGLRIREGEKVVWHRPAPSEKGSLAGFRARVREDLLVVEWQFRATGEVDPEFWLQWSNDEGKTWNALATSLRGEKAEVNISGLPSGDVAVRLLASDGFSTTVSEHVHIEVPSRGPVVSIMHPRDGQTMMSGHPMRVLGMVSSVTGEEVEVKEVRWLLDQKEVSTSLDDFVTVPSAGDHELVLMVATDDDKAEVRVRFKTIAAPDEDESPRQSPKAAK